jgi:hypothetical protein
VRLAEQVSWSFATAIGYLKANRRPVVAKLHCLGKSRRLQELGRREGGPVSGHFFTAAAFSLAPPAGALRCALPPNRGPRNAQCTSSTQPKRDLNILPGVLSVGKNGAPPPFFPTDTPSAFSGLFSAGMPLELRYMRQGNLRLFPRRFK